MSPTNKSVKHRGVGLWAKVPPGFITMHEAATLVGCDAATIYRRVQSGRLGAVRYIGRVLVKTADVKAWMKPRPYSVAEPERGRTGHAALVKRNQKGAP